MEKKHHRLSFPDFPTPAHWDFARWLFPTSPDAFASSERWRIESVYVAYPANTPWLAIQECFRDHGLAVFTSHRVSDARRKLAPFPTLDTMRFPEVLAGSEPNEPLASQALKIAKRCMARNAFGPELFLGPFYFQDDKTMLAALPSLVEKASLCHATLTSPEHASKGKLRL